MKNCTLKFLSKLTLSLLVPQLAFSSDLFKPHIQNYGSYIKTASENHYLLYGHVPPAVNYSQQKQAMNKDKILKLSIVLKWNNEQELDEKLVSITNPVRPDYQQYLSQQEFMDKYSPTSEQVEEIQRYLEKNGMHVESVSPNRLIIRAAGSVADIEKIFNTKIYYYTDKSGKTFFAPAYELQINKKLPILSVLGLENNIKPRPYLEQFKSLQPLNAAAPTQGMSPETIRTAYAVPSNLNGAGQILALYELDGYTTSDITAYEDGFNLPQVPLENVLVDGATGIPSGKGNYPMEVTLDIEMMVALAPGASKILVYEGLFGSAGLVDTFNRIATDNIAKTISTSWGIAESANTASIFQSENAIFKQMVAQGQNLFVASGDLGAYGDGKTLGVNDPASQPFVVGVGGTKLLTNPDGSYLSETTWGVGTGPGGSGGTGGISTFWTIPAWQQGVVSAATKGSNTMRNVPDVSLNSQPSTGYATYYDGSWTVVGGTSAAAPLWAAFTALVNQERANNGQGPIGFLNPTLYSIGQSANYPLTFHDIKDNSTNLYYPAVPGYDLATGWGTFIGNALINYLAGSVTPPPTTCVHSNPSVNITPSSQQSTAGGTLVYTINVTNNDNTVCSSSIFNLSATLPSGFKDTLTQNNLTVTPGTSGTTTINLTSGSNTPSGSYTFSVNAQNMNASTYVGKGSATYLINENQGQLNLTLDPKNATYPYNSQQYAKFKFTLMNGKNGVANNPINLTLKGAHFSWNSTVKTNFDGTAQYYIFLNDAMPVGTYQLLATTQYNGISVSAESTFVIQ